MKNSVLGRKLNYDLRTDVTNNSLKNLKIIFPNIAFKKKIKCLTYTTDHLEYIYTATISYMLENRGTEPHSCEKDR